MEEITIWHNPRCRKSRAGLVYLEGKGVDFSIYPYLKEGIDPAALARIIELSGEPVSTFIRTQEAIYRELGLKGKTFSAMEFADLAAKHPKLLQRPIVISGEKVVLAQPPERIDEIL